MATRPRYIVTWLSCSRRCDLSSWAIACRKIPISIQPRHLKKRLQRGDEGRQQVHTYRSLPGAAGSQADTVLAGCLAVVEASDVGEDLVVAAAPAVAPAVVVDLEPAVQDLDYPVQEDWPLCLQRGCWGHGRSREALNHRVPNHRWYVMGAHRGLRSRDASERYPPHICNSQRGSELCQNPSRAHLCFIMV